MLALALVLCAQDSLHDIPNLADLPLPREEYAEASPEEWCERFEESRLTRADAIWCLYFHDARDDATVARMRGWLAKDTTWLPMHEERARRLARETIAVVLDQWGIEHDYLGFVEEPREITGARRVEARELYLDFLHHDVKGAAAAELEDDMHLMPEGLFAPPVLPLGPDEGDPAELLGSEDDRVAARAAVTLLLHSTPEVRETFDVPRSVRGRFGELKPDETYGAVEIRLPDGSIHSESLVPTAWGGSFGGFLREPIAGASLAEFMRHWTSGYLGPVRRAVRGTALDSTVRLRECPFHGRRDPVFASERPLPGAPDLVDLDFPHAEDRVDPDLADRVLLDLRSPEPRVFAIEAAGLCGLVEPDLQPSFRGELLRIEGAGAGVSAAHAAWWRARWGEVDPALRRRYLEDMREWLASDNHEPGARRLYFLRYHDAETLSVLREVLQSKVLRPRTLFALRFAELTGGEHPEIVALALRSAPDRPIDFAGLQRGELGLPEIHDDPELPDRALQLGVRVRTLRALGQPYDAELRGLREILHVSPDSVLGSMDCYETAMFVVRHLALDEDERIVDRVIELLHDFRWSEDAAACLHELSLSRRQQSHVARFGNENRRHQSWPSALLARQGPAAVEALPRLRIRAVEGDDLQGDVEAFRATLEIGRFSHWHERYLVRGLLQAPASRRLELLRTIHEYRLDTPELRQAVARSTQDFEPFCASTARRILERYTR